MRQVGGEMEVIILDAEMEPHGVLVRMHESAGTRVGQRDLEDNKTQHV